MKRYDQNYLKTVLYLYWMTRVPNLDEGEAIDHLEWELRNFGFIPDLDKKTCTVSSSTKKSLRKFLKSKKVKLKGI